MSEQAYYSTTAWRPTDDSGDRKRPRPQLDVRSRSFRMQWEAGRKLSKSYIPDLVPGDFLENWRPRLGDESTIYVEKGQLADEALPRTDGDENEKVPMAWMNHESFRWTTLPKFAWRWLLVKAIAKFLLIAGTPILLLSLLHFYVFLNEHFEGVFRDAFIPTVFYGGGMPVPLGWGQPV
ncbi:hypothetical protein [Marinobacter sp. LN3S78]|uniref:hypothetical protein n=1 Tax=Marinobacter sp. LN3S78 TaxID=3382300 RepID=UPI00387B6DE6